MYSADILSKSKTFRSLLLAVALFCFSLGSTHAQSGLLEKEVDVKPGRKTVESILAEMAQQGINLSYSDNAIPIHKLVEIKVTPRSVYQHFLTMFNSERVAFEERGSTILLYKSNQRVKKKITISGVVKDANSGENLIGAHIWIDSLKLGTTSNEYGFYSLSIRQGKHQLISSYLGYETTSPTTEIIKNTRINFEIDIKTPYLREVIISPREREVELSETPAGYNKIDLQLMGKLPYFLGEVDILQSTLLLPGIKTLGEDAIGLNIRGGNADQNLILLDDAPIYNSSHLFGLISVFNPDAVSHAEVFKSGIPVAYGGRASSIINIRKREGNNKEYHVTGGLGLASTRIMAEGPIIMDRSSFLVSARSSFTNFNFFNFSDKVIFQDNSASFHDVNAKFHFKLNRKNTIYFSGYFGNDRNRIGDNLLRRWGNRTATVRWNRQITARMFMNNTIYASNYSYTTGQPNKGIGEFTGTSAIIDYAIKSDFSFFKSPKNSYDFGTGLIFHRLNPGDREPNIGNETFNPIALDSEHAFEPYIYFSNHRKISDRLSINLGLRLSSMYKIGPGDVFVYNDGESKEKSSISDTIPYKKNELVKRYAGIEPRVTFNYLIGENSAIKWSYDRTLQYLHLISNTISPSPTDIWKLSSTYIKPQTAHQVTIGYYRTIKTGLDASVEFYGRKTKNITEYKDGADLLLNDAIETELINAKGRSYGIEFLIKKKSDRFNGWLSYTVSRSERKMTSALQNEQLNDRTYFPADFDRTHDLAVVGIYQLSKRWSLSSNFIFRTGRPIALPESKYEFENSIISNFTLRNQGRIANYHRMDVSATLKTNKGEMRKNGKTKKLDDSWTFSIYNLYAQRNAFSLLFRQSDSNPYATEVIKSSILGTIIPSVTYNFRF